MYENISYEEILERMLNLVPSHLDRREGSIIMNAVAPCAMELYLAYTEFDKIIAESFADTQSRDFLIRRAAERGLSPMPATASRWICNILGNVEIGHRFRSGEFTFKVIDYAGIDLFLLECEQLGSASNVLEEELLPIDYISVLIHCYFESLDTKGQDEEDTETFRNRYFEFVNAQPFGGNRADYIEKARSIAGISAVKVVSIWNGPGTVKLVILGADNKSPVQSFVEEVQNIFDPTKDGGGNGLVPIGHICTVEGAKTVAVNLSFSYSKNSQEDIYDAIINAIDDYFAVLVKKWGNTDFITVRKSQLEAQLLSVDGVEDILNFRINGSENNLVLGYDTIAVRGEVDATIT